MKENCVYICAAILEINVVHLELATITHYHSPLSCKQLTKNVQIETFENSLLVSILA